MKKIIHNLRQKSQHKKEGIAFFGALIITFFIAMFWLAGVLALKKPVDSDQMANINTPFSEIKSQINIILKDFKDGQVK